jgi:hypothetical protein
MKYTAPKTANRSGRVTVKKEARLPFAKAVMQDTTAAKNSTAATHSTALLSAKNPTSAPQMRKKQQSENGFL